MRYDDNGCANQGWQLVFPEGYLGGCDIINGIEFCTHPSERYDHGSTIFNDGCVIVLPANECSRVISRTVTI